jgi:hypothetical protein
MEDFLWRGRTLYLLARLRKTHCSLQIRDIQDDESAAEIAQFLEWVGPPAGNGELETATRNEAVLHKVGPL